MGSLLIAAATVWRLTFTIPGTEAPHPDSCGVSGSSPERMGAIVVMRRAPGAPSAVEHLRWNVAGMEGYGVEWSLALEGAWFVSLIAIDAAGNAACASAEVLLDPATVSVPLEPDASSERPRIFDVMGRRVEPPLAPGVYWRADHGRPRRLVVVR